MENINWICKAKTVNNNIVWMCSPKIKEHFESTFTTALLGTTAFPNTVDITLGPASFGPTSDLCKDTTGFTKLGEWTLATNDGSAAMNDQFWKGNTQGIMVYDGVKTTDWSKWPNEWQYRYQLPYLCGIDKNGFNAAIAILDFQSYQDFCTQKYKIIFRNKNNPQNYFLMPRVSIISAGPKGLIGISADNYDPGYSQDRNLTNYSILGWTPEFSMRGQGGGSVVYNEVYEVFVKPFTRPTFLFKREPKVNDFSTLDSNIASKLFFWLDGSDPLANGSVLADDTQVPYWFDKSSNKIRFVRALENTKIKDGEKMQDGGRLRVPRAKASIKNGLSTMRFNGRQGYKINMHDPEDPVTTKFIQNPVNTNITEYTVISLQFTADYGPGNGSRIFSPDNYSGGFYTAIGNFQFDAPMLSAWTNANNRNNHNDVKTWNSNVNVLGQWSLFTVVVSNSDLSFYVNGVKGKNNLLEWQLNQKPYEAKDGKLLALNNCCIVGDGGGGNSPGAAFTGDMAELLFFRGALSDDDRQKVEGYLGIKWNIASSLPTSNPDTIDIANSAQLFTGTNYGGNNNYFPVGRYNNSQLKTIGVKTLQSLKVPSGLQVLLYQNGDFTGLGKSIIADTADLSSVTDSRNSGFKWNNQMQSLIVQKYIPLPTSISSDMPPISLISSDASSFLSTVKGAVLTRIDGKDYLFVDPSNKDNIYWYNASDLQVTPK